MTTSGLYCIVCEITRTVSVTIGTKRRQEIAFGPGWYVYTGSGGCNVWRRVARHMNTNKRVRWNIDTLTVEQGVQISSALVFPQAAHSRECELNRLVGEVVDGDTPALRFGSHDCRNCPAHLWYSGHAVDAESLARAIPFGPFAIVDQHGSIAADRLGGE